MIELLNMDCMEYMAGLPDKAFDLAIVDPPYGIGEALVAGGTWSVKYQDKGAGWDVAPEEAYFKELARVADNYIVWGANYYCQHLKPARGFITWVKPNMVGMHTMADCELAFTSFDRNARVLNLSSQSKENRIHVCQKPVALYEWLLTNYAKTGDRILDTHGGSMSSVIACLNLGFEVTCCELDSDYFATACERVRNAQRQQPMFAPEPMKQIQEALA